MFVIKETRYETPCTKRYGHWLQSCITLVYRFTSSVNSS